MDIPSLDVDRSCSGIEILVFQFSDCTAVHRVAVSCPEFLHIELDGSPSYFLVRSEGYLDFPVLEFGMFHHVLCGVHYLRHTCLVVCSEQGGPVGSDDGLPPVLQQLRELADFQAQFFIELYIIPVIVRYYLRMYVFA